MNPIVISVTERNTLDQRNQVVRSVVVTYKVGNFGPFTLITSAGDIANGTANQQMQAFANTLTQLPGAGQ